MLSHTNLLAGKIKPDYDSDGSDSTYDSEAAAREQIGIGLWARNMGARLQEEATGHDPRAVNVLTVLKAAAYQWNRLRLWQESIELQKYYQAHIAGATERARNNLIDMFALVTPRIWPLLGLVQLYPHPATTHKNSYR